jgi:hypothetical protein
MNTDHLDGVLDQFTLEQGKAAVDELGRLLDAALQPNGMELLAAFLNDLHHERLAWWGYLATPAGRASCCLTTNPTELCAVEGVCDAPCVLTLTGPDHRQGVHACHGGLVLLSYCPRSSLPAPVLAWLAARLAHLLAPHPPGQGRQPAAAPGGPPGRRRGGRAGRAVVPARRAGGRDLQDRGGRQHGPAAS